MIATSAVEAADNRPPKDVDQNLDANVEKPQGQRIVRLYARLQSATPLHTELGNTACNAVCDAVFDEQRRTRGSTPFVLFRSIHIVQQV